MARDARGRFAAGNAEASLGGKARARSLSKRRRRAIARKARRAMVAKHLGGDERAARRYFAELGAFAGDPYDGDPVPRRFFHPGPIQGWRARFYQLGLWDGLHLDVEFARERA